MSAETRKPAEHMLLADGVAPAEGVVDVSEGVMRVAEGLLGIADGHAMISDGRMNVSGRLMEVAGGLMAISEVLMETAEGVVGAVEYLMRVLEGIPGIADGFERLCCAYLIIQKDILFCLQVRPFKRKGFRETSIVMEYEILAGDPIFSLADNSRSIHVGKLLHA